LGIGLESGSWQTKEGKLRLWLCLKGAGFGRWMRLRYAPGSTRGREMMDAKLIGIGECSFGPTQCCRLFVDRKRGISRADYGHQCCHRLIKGGSEKFVSSLLQDSAVCSGTTCRLALTPGCRRYFPRAAQNVMRRYSLRARLHDLYSTGKSTLRQVLPGMLAVISLARRSSLHHDTLISSIHPLRHPPI
jgi:hypothetical protein